MVAKQIECPYCGRYFYTFQMVAVSKTHWTVEKGWVDDHFFICQHCDEGGDE